MINVLLIVKRYSGDYALVNEMARLDPRKYRCAVCYLAGDKDGKNSLDERISTYYLGLQNSEISPLNKKARRLLVEIFDKEQTHVVNCHLQRTVPLALAASWMARRRPAVLATLHGLGSAGSWRLRLGNWLHYRAIYKLIGVSEGVRRDILQNNWAVKPKKVVTIHNGIDPDPFLLDMSRGTARESLFPDGGGGCWFGSLGRLTEVKNQRTLLRAFARVIAVEPSARLLLAGRGELESELKSLSLSLGLAERVVFLGYRQDVPLILRALDVFVLPSLREGLPLSLMEAMCSGLPAIASRVGGIPELFGDADMGKLVDPQDEKSLADAMISMSRLSGEERRRLGDNARSRVLASFTAKEMTRRYEAVYADAFRTLCCDKF